MIRLRPDGVVNRGDGAIWSLHGQVGPGVIEGRLSKAGLDVRSVTTLHRVRAVSGLRAIDHTKPDWHDGRRATLIGRTPRGTHTRHGRRESRVGEGTTVTATKWIR